MNPADFLSPRGELFEALWPGDLPGGSLEAAVTVWLDQAATDGGTEDAMKARTYVLAYGDAIRRQKVAAQTERADGQGSATYRRTAVADLQQDLNRWLEKLSQATPKPKQRSAGFDSVQVLLRS